MMVLEEELEQFLEPYFNLSELRHVTEGLIGIFVARQAKLRDMIAAKDVRIEELKAGLTEAAEMIVKDVHVNRLQARIEELEALMSPNYQYDQHIMEVEDDGTWAIQHPLACRPNLLDCEYTKNVNRFHPGLNNAGRYEVEHDEGWKVTPI